MVKDDMVYLRHMLDFAMEVGDMLAGKTHSDFEADRVLQVALVHMIQNVAEAARRISAEGRAKHSEIPWQEIVGMRSVIVHDYLHVDYEAVWEVASVKLPELAKILKRIVPPYEDGSY